MTTTVNPGLDLAALHAHLDASGVPVDGELQAHLITGGKSNLTYLIADGSSRWILRRPPTGGLTPSAHDVGREFRVISALQESGVPVAKTVILCEEPSVLGAPFSLVAYVAGDTVQTRQELAALSDRQVDVCVDDLVRVLADLHRVDPALAGLADFGRPRGYLGRQVATWCKQWHRVKHEDSTDFGRLHSMLSDAVPTESAASIIHGDFRIDNTILRPDHTVAAVVDWEMSTVGDPLADAALMCAYRSPALDLVIGEPAAWTSSRLPSPTGLAERYASASGRELTHWDFYLALANYKVAVIAQGISHRHQVGATVGEGFDRAGEAVPEFIAAGLRALCGRT